MSSSSSEDLRRFLTEFVLPLVSAGEVHVGAPYPVARVEEMAQELVSAQDLVHKVDAVRTRTLAAIVVNPPVLQFGYEELCIAAGLHNTLFLSHPRMAPFDDTDKKARRILSHARALADQSKADSVETALARHALLANVFRVRRADVKLSWWTGVASFQGQRPPKRLTTFRGLRRVKEETEWVGFSKLFSAPEARRVLAIILRGSPLTQMLAVHSDAPVLHWEDAAELLRNSELCRAICAVALSTDEPHRAPARLAAGLELMLERSPEEQDVRAVVALLVYLNLLLSESGSGRESFVDLLRPEQATGRPTGLSFLAALPAAAARVDPRLSHPPGLSTSAKRDWFRHREHLSSLVGEEVARAEGLLRRYLQAQLPAG